ncbi:MAG: ABC transporter permease [Erysipelotrichaceae bacterium]|nr:ABC transporter permease [Erysipelotrichaceae bacterium]
MSAINWDQMIVAIKETILMTSISLFFAVIFGGIIGILLYITQKDSLCQIPIFNRITDFIINVFRAIPFIILLCCMIPITIILVGGMLGFKAAIPSLVVSATPFYARMCLIAFNEVDKGTIEASKSMGASNLEIMLKVVLPESAPALVSGIALLGVNLVGYTAMAGAIGSGGLGNLAYMYGYVRRNNAILYTSTAIVVLIVFVIQYIGDVITRRIDKR